MIKSHDKNFLDKLLIGLQVLIIVYGLSFNILDFFSTILSYHSPFVSTSLIMELVMKNIYLISLFLAAGFLTVLIIRKYSRIKIITLFTITLILEFLIQLYTK